jgi:glycosyltransferase involved in cell wall biosynthesis
VKTISYYSKYDRLGVGSRLRFYQFTPELYKYFLVKVNILFPSDYIPNLFNSRPQNKLQILSGFIRRMLELYWDKSDIIVIQRELFPYLPYFIEKLCLHNKKYILDLDDADYLRYSQHRNSLVRKFLATKFNCLFKAAAAVTVGNNYLVNYVNQQAPGKAIYFPTVIDLDKYKLRPKSPALETNSIVIGWIGSNTTFQYIYSLIPILEQVAQQVSQTISFHIVGANLPISIQNCKIEYIEWSEDLESDLIHNFDIGVMPLDDSEWEKGKCAYKIIQYMGCAKAVVASAIGANNSVICNAVNGFLCLNNEEWIAALVTLINSAELRQKFGAAGRHRVEQSFSLQKQAPELIKLLNRL